MITHIGELTAGASADIAGRVRTVQVGTLHNTPVFTCEIEDDTGALTALFQKSGHTDGHRPAPRARPFHEAADHAAHRLPPVRCGHQPRRTPR